MAPVGIDPSTTATGIALFPVVLPLYTGQSASDAGLLVELSQIMFVFILTVSLTAICAGVANTHHLFSVPALSPVILNLAFITAYLALSLRDLSAEDNARHIAKAAVAGGFLQLIVQLAYLRRRKLWPVFTLMAPAVLGAGLFQFNQLTDIAIASWFIPAERGAIPALKAAHRLMQLPTGVVGAALATAILPALARAGGRNSHELGSSLAFGLFLTVPAGLGLFMIGPHIINLLLYGGAWDENSTKETYDALRFYSLGVPFFSLSKVLTSAFYAREDTKTPVKVMVFVVAFNFALNLLLVGPLRQGGLALSTSVCAGLTSLSLGLMLRRADGAIPFLRPVLRQVPCYLSLFAYLWLLNAFLPDFGLESVRLRALLNVGLGAFGGGAPYLLCARLFRVEELNVLRRP